MTGSKWASTSKEEDAGVLMAGFQKGQGFQRCWKNWDKNQAGRWDQHITPKQKIQHIPSCQILHDQPSQAPKQAGIQVEETQIRCQWWSKVWKTKQMRTAQLWDYGRNYYGQGG